MKNENIYPMDNKELNNSFVEVVQINLENEYRYKLEQINLFESQVIYIVSSDDKNIIQFVIDNAKYAIRSKDANCIFVKKVNNINECLL